MISRFGGDDFAVYAGSERFLLDTLRAGGAGCISATANVNPVAIVEAARRYREEGADDRQEALNEVRGLFEAYPLIPAMKAVTAHFSGEPGWRRVRPPLVELDSAGEDLLVSSLTRNGFRMAGLR